MSKILIGKYHATIYRDGDRYTGAISLGFDARGNRRRIKRKGRTKTAVQDRLIEAVKELDDGIKTSATYTVADAVRDWLDSGWCSCWRITGLTTTWCTRCAARRSRRRGQKMTRWMRRSYAGRPSSCAGPGPGPIRLAGGHGHTQEAADCCFSLRGRGPAAPDRRRCRDLVPPGSAFAFLAEHRRELFPR